jgi:membrane protein involved in colicin uptake
MGTLAPTVAPSKRRVGRWLAIAGAVAVLLGLVGGGVAWKIADDARVAAAEAETAAAKAAADQREEQEREEAAAAAAQERRDEADRAARRASVSNIEASVKTMAEKHAADGIIDGPIIEVSCSPVGGGSTDDLTEQTTVFECFAAYKDNGDGTMSGWTYNATMNWSSGSYTYGLGAA